MCKRNVISAGYSAIKSAKYSVPAVSAEFFLPKMLFLPNFKTVNSFSTVHYFPASSTWRTGCRLCTRRPGATWPTCLRASTVSTSGPASRTLEYRPSPTGRVLAIGIFILDHFISDLWYFSVQKWARSLILDNIFSDLSHSRPTGKNSYTTLRRTTRLSASIGCVATGPPWGWARWSWWWGTPRARLGGSNQIGSSTAPRTAIRPGTWLVARFRHLIRWITKIQLIRRKYKVTMVGLHNVA